MTDVYTPADLPTRIQHYIDGAFVDSIDGDTFEVLNPVTNETYVHAAAGKKADIDLAVVDADTIHQAEQAAARLGRVANVHLKIDTGMRRIGCEPADASELARLVAESEHLSLRGVFTHLPISDMADGMDWTIAELDLFRATVAAAMLDRLLHRSVVITLDGASYRLRNHHAAADELRRITTGTNLR